MQGVNLIGLGFGSCSVSQTPSITSVVDNGDQDSITVTVVGTGTIQLYYREKYTSSWTTGLTRSGSGDIVQAGLTAGKWYELYITDTITGNAESAPSKISIIKISEIDGNTIETALVSILTGDATIEGFVGSGVYPNLVPQGKAMPAITYQQISGPRDQTLSGPSGLVNARYQINCWSDVYSESRQLADAVRKEINGFSGTVNTVVIEVIQLDDESDIPQVRPGADVLTRFGKRIDFIVWFQEATS